MAQFKDYTLKVNDAVSDGGIAGLDMNNQVLPNVGDPVSTKDAVNKQYLDNKLGDLSGAFIIKGSLDATGAASQLADAKEGWLWVVSVAGTLLGKVLKVGAEVYCKTAVTGTPTNFNNFDSIPSEEDVLRIVNDKVDFLNAQLENIDKVTINPVSGIDPLLIAHENWSGALASWSHRAQISLTASAAITDYQVRLTVNTQALISASKMQANGNDIRITASNGTTILPHHIETGINTTTTVIYFKSTLASGANTFYLYYGNATAPSVDAPDNVFDFYDGFPGTSVDTGKWTVDNATGVSISGGNLVIAIDTGRLRSTWNYSGTLSIVETKFNSFADFNSGGLPVGITANSLWSSASSGLSFLSYDGANDWYRLEATWVPIGNVVALDTDYVSTIRTTSATNIHLSITDYSTGENTYDNATLPRTIANTDRIMLGERGDDTGDSTGNIGYDWVRVRKYLATEPTPTVGTEENATTDMLLKVATDGVVTVSNKIENVTAGTNPKDVINKSQLDAIAGVAGNNTQLQYNDAGGFGATVNLTYDVSTGYASFGNNTGSPYSGAIKITGTTDVNTGLILTNFYSNDSNPPAISHIKYRGTPSAPTSVQNNDGLSRIRVGGRAATTEKVAGDIVWTATENWTDTSHGCAFIIQKSKTGTSSSPTALKIDGNNDTILSENLGVKGVTPKAEIHLSDNLENKKIILYGDLDDDDHQFYGFGVNGGILRYNISSPSASHVFYAGVDAATSNELARIVGNGDLRIKGALRVEGGTPAAGEKLISADAAGNAAWGVAATGEVVGGGGVALNATAVSVLQITLPRAGKYRIMGGLRIIGPSAVDVWGVAGLRNITTATDYTNSSEIMWFQTTTTHATVHTYADITVTGADTIALMGRMGAGSATSHSDANGLTKLTYLAL